MPLIQAVSSPKLDAKTLNSSSAYIENLLTIRDKIIFDSYLHLFYTKRTDKNIRKIRQKFFTEMERKM